jgi:hypothetical protein
MTKYVDAGKVCAVFKMEDYVQMSKTPEGSRECELHVESGKDFYVVALNFRASRLMPRHGRQGRHTHRRLGVQKEG